MPRKIKPKVSKRRGTKRVGKKRRMKRSIFNVIPKGGIWPDRYRTKLKCAFDFTSTLTTTNPQFGQYYNALRGNCVINCGSSFQAANGTGTMSAYSFQSPSSLEYLLSSSQPTGVSIAPYNRYTVLSSSVRLKFMPGGSNVCPVEICLFPIAQETFNKTLSIGPGLMKEQPFAKTLYLNPDVTTEKVATITHKMSTRKIYGYLGNVLLEESFSGAMNVSSGTPPQSWVWLMSFCNMQLTPAMQSVVITSVQIEYDCVFYERNFLRDGIPV